MSVWLVAPQAEPPSELELQRAKNQLEASRIFEQDSNFRRAMLLGQSETIGAGWKWLDEFLDHMKAVTAEDIQRVAKQYLVPDNRTVGILIPLPSKAQEPSPGVEPQRKS